MFWLFQYYIFWRKISSSSYSIGRDWIPTVYYARYVSKSAVAKELTAWSPVFGKRMLSTFQWR